MPHHANPVAFVKGADDVRAYGDTADFFDLTAGNRLSIGHQRQRLQQRAGVARRALLPQATDPGAQLLANLKAETTGHLSQLVASALAALFDFIERFADVGVVGPFVILKQCTQLGNTQGLTGGKQGRLDNLHQTNCITHSARPLT